MDQIVNTLAAINRNNIYTKFIQKDDLNEPTKPTDNEIKSNTAKYAIYKGQYEYMTRYSYTKQYNPSLDYTLYYNCDILNKAKRSPSCVLYVPGFGRNFTLMNLNTLYEDNGMDLFGIDLPNYGDSYRHKSMNVNYNTIVNIDGYFDALNHAIETIRSKYGYQTVILMGHDVGGLICTNYIIDNRYANKPDMLVLESPLFEFKDGAFPIPIDIANTISPFLYSLMPDLIISRDDDDPDWLRKNPFFSDTSVPIRHTGYVDYLYNPLSNKPVYVSYLYHVFKMCNTIASITKPVTNIPILLFYNPNTIATTDAPYIDPYINVEVLKNTVDKITTKPSPLPDTTYRHEIMLDCWTNIKKCVETIGRYVKK